MTATIMRAIPKATSNGVLKLPVSAWAEIKRIAKAKFGSTVSVRDRDKPFPFDGRPWVPYAHYFFEAEIDVGACDRFIEWVDPLIEALITTHTQQWNVPARR